MDDLRRGDIVLVALDPVVAPEQGKHRPAVLVSRNEAIDAALRIGAGVLTVVPMTSNVSRVYDFQVLLPADTVGMSMDSKAQAEQIRSVSLARVVRRIGALNGEALAALDAALRLHLDL